MITRMVVQTTIWLTAMGAILFLAAGDWGWPQGWAFLGEIAISTFAVSFRACAAGSTAPGTAPSWPLVFVSWLVMSAFDARRFGWSLCPLWVKALGAVLIALCMIVVWQTFRFNTFATPHVRVQIDRKQYVITDGPYRIGEKTSLLLARVCSPPRPVIGEAR